MNKVEKRFKDWEDAKVKAAKRANRKMIWKRRAIKTLKWTLLITLAILFIVPIIVIKLVSDTLYENITSGVDHAMYNARSTHRNRY